MTTGELAASVTARLSIGVTSIQDMLRIIPEDAEIESVVELRSSEGLIALADVAGSAFCDNDLDGCRGVLFGMIDHKIISAARLARQLGTSAASLRRQLGADGRPTADELRRIMTAVRILGRPTA